MVHDRPGAGPSSAARYEWASARPRFRPTVVRSRYYLSAYLRYALSLVVFAGLLVVPAREVHRTLFAAVIRGFLESSADPPNAGEIAMEEALGKFPIWEQPLAYPFDDPGVVTLIEGTPDVFAWLFTQGFVLVPLVAGGAVAVLLERSSRRRSATAD